MACDALSVSPPSSGRPAGRLDAGDAAGLHCASLGARSNGLPSPLTLPTVGEPLMSKTFKARLASASASAHSRFSGAPSALAARCFKSARNMDTRTLATFAIVGTMLAASPAYAQAGGAGNVETFLQNIVNIITGNVGKLIAVIAIVGTGIAWMFGAASMRTLGTVIIGVLLIFSASWIVGQITGGG